MNEPIDLGVALDTVVAALQAQFPSYKTVAAEDESRSALEVPALVVQFSSIEPDYDSDPMTGRFSCLLTVEARIVFGHRTPKVRREVIKAAGALATFVSKNRLGVAWGGAVVGAIEPDEFVPIADTFDVWRVEWTHAVDLGDDYQVPAGLFDMEAAPTEVHASFAPEVGTDHVADYEVVSDD